MCRRADACGVCNGPGEIYECGCADILKETATVTETSLTSAASVAVTASLPETATAMATSLTPSENAEVLVKPMRTPMASATTLTHVSESSTLVACATDQEPSTSADALTSLKETATDGNVLDECGICGGDGNRRLRLRRQPA